MANKKPVDLSLPVKGYDENWAYKAQPEGTSPDVLNVRPYDVLGQRLRGGQRAGSSKYIATQPNGASPIQMLIQEPVIGSGFLESFPDGDGTDFDSRQYPWRHYAWSGAPWLGTPAGATVPAAWVTLTAYRVGDQASNGGNTYVCIITHTSGTFATDLAAGKWELYTALANPGLIQGNAYQVTVATPDPMSAHVCQESTATGDMTIGMTVTHSGIVDESGTIGILVRVATAADPGYWIQYLPATSTTSPWVFVLDEAANILLSSNIGGYPQAWAPTGAAPGQTTMNTPVRLVVTVEGANMHIYLNSILVGQIVGGIVHATQKLAGFVTYQNLSAGNIYNLTDISVSSITAPTGTSTRILACSNGSVYSGVASGTWATISTGMNPTGIVRAQTAFGKAYLCDGVAAHYNVYDPATRTLVAWTPTAGSLPTGTSDPSLGATVMALYRGRVVLSGIADDSQNWFMSKAGDPLDWNYGATVSAVMAVAGNNSVAGLVGDRVTALAPANDDLMVIGCDHTLWIMRGDPADGGRIDNVSNQVGVVGPDAHTFDPSSNLYFFGNGILWRMTPDGQLAPLSRGRMDKTFGAIDFSTSNMRLLWDDILCGLHIFVTPIVSGASTHYWWDARTDGFWLDQRPNAHGPTAVLRFDANAPNDRAVLLGGQDGYVRKIDSTAKTDDGTTILSRVKFPPMTPGSVHQNARLSRTTAILDSTSDPVSLRIFSAQSPKEAVADTVPAWSMMVSPTVRYSVPRVGGNSLLFELKNDSFSTAWVTGTVYAVGAQVVAADGNPYVCIVAHTSTTAGAHPTPPGNVTDWVLSSFRTWALESLSAIMDVTGRTRHGRI